MTMLLTRMHEIADREGFEIEVWHQGRRLKNLRRNGVLGPYPYARKARDGWTVDRWRQDHFVATYPGYSCDVLMGNGQIAPGQTLLRTVRESYEE